MTLKLTFFLIILAAVIVSGAVVLLTVTDLERRVEILESQILSKPSITKEEEKAKQEFRKLVDDYIKIDPKYQWGSKESDLKERDYDDGKEARSKEDVNGRPEKIR